MVAIMIVTWNKPAVSGCSSSVVTANDVGLPSVAQVEQ